MWPCETNASEITIEMHNISFTKTHLKMPSWKRRPFCLGLNVLSVHTTKYHVIILTAVDLELNAWMMKLEQRNQIKMSRKDEMARSIFIKIIRHKMLVIKTSPFLVNPLEVDQIYGGGLACHAVIMMTSSNGNIFRVTGHLCGEFTGLRWIPHTKASDVELWCFLCSASE